MENEYKKIEELLRKAATAWCDEESLSLDYVETIMPMLEAVYKKGYSDAIKNIEELINKKT